MKEIVEVVDQMNKLNCSICSIEQFLSQMENGCTLSGRAVMGLADTLASWNMQIDSCIILLETYKNKV